MQAPAALLPQVCASLDYRSIFQGGALAEVACRQLGLPPPALHMPGAFWEIETAPLAVSAVVCQGSEARLDDCYYINTDTYIRVWPFACLQTVDVACNATGALLWARPRECCIWMQGGYLHAAKTDHTLMHRYNRLHPSVGLRAVAWRLANTTNNGTAGRLEVSVNGVWGQVSHARILALPAHPPTRLPACLPLPCCWLADAVSMAFS